MYDKLVLTTVDFEVGKDSLIRTSPMDTGIIDKGEGFPLFKCRETGEVKHGKKCYFDIEIQDAMRFIVNINSYGLQLIVNPSKIVNGWNNLRTADNEGMRMTLDYMQKSLDKYGVFTNIDNAVISRLDLAQTERVKNPFIAYPFEYMQGKRMNKRGYGTTFTFENRQREICFYDKITHLVHEYKIKDPYQTFGIEKGANLMREEYRALKKGTVKRDLGIDAVRELEKKEVFIELENKHRRLVGELVFRDGAESTELFNYSTELEILKRYRKEYPRGAIDKFLTDRAIPLYLDKVKGMEGIRKLMVDADFTRTYISDYITKLQKRMNQNADMVNAAGGNDAIELYRELREVFYKTA